MGLPAAGGAGACGFAGVTGAVTTGEVGAFFTDRIDLPGTGLAGEAAGWLGDPPLPSRLRIFPASESLIELLWLLAAIESFSAASNTSLFSRPRSLDNS